MERLIFHHWPGNIRQLANEVRRLAALAESGAYIQPDDLSPEFRGHRLDTHKPAGDLGPQMAVRIDQRLDKATELLEAAMIKHALRQSRGHVATAAASLGISRKGLYLKRVRLGLEDFNPETSPLAVDRRADPVPNHLTATSGCPKYSRPLPTSRSRRMSSGSSTVQTCTRCLARVRELDESGSRRRVWIRWCGPNRHLCDRLPAARWCGALSLMKWLADPSLYPRGHRIILFESMRASSSSITANTKQIVAYSIRYPRPSR